MTGADPSTLSRHLQFAIANIYRCLAPCKECTGNYISELLQKRFVCHCRCHNTTNSSFGSATIRLKEAGVTYAQIGEGRELNTTYDLHSHRNEGRVNSSSKNREILQDTSSVASLEHLAPVDSSTVIEDNNSSKLELRQTGGEEEK
jgi:hypothetical protein